MEERKRLDEEDRIPKAWQDGTFSNDPHDKRRIQPPPQKYREWLVSQRTRREAHEALPVYRIPQQAYLMQEYKKKPNEWAQDSHQRLYTMVPKGDEAAQVLGRDVRSNEVLMYVVCVGAKAEFPRDTFTLIKPHRVDMQITFSHFDQHRAVGLIVAKKRVASKA